MLRRILLAALFAGLVSPAIAGQVNISISIADQVMDVALDGQSIYSFDVSTGRKGHATPMGTYQPYAMYKSWFSHKYDNAPMPWSIFFKGGFAIHGTTDVRHLGRVASHGCVRLDPKNARMLFALIQQNGAANTVITIGS